MFWYIGVPAVILATVAAALLSRRCLRGQAPTWTLPLITFAWAIVTFLYRPAITPDQPWASRRLVPAVLPGFILLAVWASSWLVGWLNRHGYAGVPSVGSAVVLVVALLLPPAMTTFGLGVKTGGPSGIKVAADGLAFKTTYQGEIGAVNGLCAAIPKDSSVVFVDGPIDDRFAQVVRGMCGDPTARVTTAPTDPRTHDDAGDRAEHPAGRAAAGNSRRRRVGTRALRRPSEGGHGAEHHTGRDMLTAPPLDYLAIHAKHLDVGAWAVTATRTASAPSRRTGVSTRRL